MRINYQEIMANVDTNLMNSIIPESHNLFEPQEENEHSDEYHWGTLFSNCSKLVLKNSEWPGAVNRMYISKLNKKQEHFPEQKSWWYLSVYLFYTESTLGSSSQNPKITADRKMNVHKTVYFEVHKIRNTHA